jgi:imidazolonepropionase
VKDGSLLLHNGVVHEAGSAQRVDNLKQARNAREVDVGGRIVMPAFVDPDAVLVYSPSGRHSGSLPTQATRLCVVSKHRLAQTGAAAAADWVRCGVLAAGAHTGHASDLRETLRILRIHQTLQGKPLRIRSIYSPDISAPNEAGKAEPMQTLMARALPAIRTRKLAGIVEFTLEGRTFTEESRAAHRAEIPARGQNSEVIRPITIAAAEAGYHIRIRMYDTPDPERLELTFGAAAVAMIAPPAARGDSLGALHRLAQLGCVHIFQATAALRQDWDGAAGVRAEIDEGIPVALASGFRPGVVSSLNPQFLLHLAVERFGMTPAEAIAAFTYNAACSLRMSHVTGSLEHGKAADLLVMDVADYHELIERVGHNDVLLAMRDGKPVYRRCPLMLD